MRVKIYSNEHTAWWKANYFGYTNNESEAGIFEIEEVNKKYPYIDFDTTKEDYLVKFNKITYEELEKENEKLKKTLEILKKYLYYDNKNHAIKMKEVRKSIYNFDYEDLKEMLECQKR